MNCVILNGTEVIHFNFPYPRDRVRLRKEMDTLMARLGTTWQAVADLFVEDAVCDFGPFGHPEGKKAIGEHFNMERRRMPFRLHLLHNPVIKLDVDKAKGKWSFQAYVTQASTNRAIEVAGEYNCDYVRTKVGWKFKVCACRFHYITPYDEGWVKSNLAEF